MAESSCRTSRTGASWPRAHAHDLAAGPHALPAQDAVVVLFREPFDGRDAVFRGEVEHVLLPVAPREQQVDEPFAVVSDPLRIGRDRQAVLADLVYARGHEPRALSFVQLDLPESAHAVGLEVLVVAKGGS